MKESRKSTVISHDGKVKMVIRRDPEWDEWVVRYYEKVNASTSGRHKWESHHGKFYHTQEKKDAYDTMYYTLGKYESDTFRKVMLK